MIWEERGEGDAKRASSISSLSLPQKKKEKKNAACGCEKKIRGKTKRCLLSNYFYSPLLLWEGKKKRKKNLGSNPLGEEGMKK